MKIAIISDIHGNLQALSAVVEDIKRSNVDHIICLGDVATLGPNPREVTNIIRSLNCMTIMGNHEEALLDPYNAENFDIKGEVLSKTIFWCLERLTKDDIEYFMGFQRKICLPIGKNKKLFLYHGSPKSSTGSICPDTDINIVDGYFNYEEYPDIAVGGHTHLQMSRKIKDTIFLNPGSVGCAFRVPSRKPPAPSILNCAEYALIKITDDLTEIDLRSISYDFFGFYESIVKSDLPLKDWWIDEINNYLD